MTNTISSFSNILLILGFFYYINIAKSIETKSEKRYLVKNNTLVLGELALPESRLLINKSTKINNGIKKKVIKQNKQIKNINTLLKTKDKNKLENKIINIIIKYLPDEEKPESNEIDKLKVFFFES